VLFRGHAELVVEGVVPDLLHVVPVGHCKPRRYIFSKRKRGLQARRIRIRYQKRMCFSFTSALHM
jgi:hypothetical protein